MDQAPRRSAPPRTDARDQRGALPALPRATRASTGVNWLLYLVATAILQPAFLIWFRLSAHRPRARPGQGRPDRRLQPPQLPRPVRDRRDPARGGGRCSTSPRSSCSSAAGRAGSSPALGAFPIRRGQSDETAMETARLVARARRHGRASSPRAPGSGRARSATPEARRRPAGARDRRRGRAGRRARHRARPPRLADPPAQGEAARRAGR